MRLTPAQLGVYLICGHDLPMYPRPLLAERLRAGRAMLAEITGHDFRYDLKAWHTHLKESREGGYTWARNIILPKVMKEALASDDWRRTARELENEGLARRSR